MRDLSRSLLAALLEALNAAQQPALSINLVRACRSTRLPSNSAFTCTCRLVQDEWVWRAFFFSLCEDPHDAFSRATVGRFAQRLSKHCQVGSID
jgi:hypothetical protein